MPRVFCEAVRRMRAAGDRVHTNVGSCSKRSKGRRIDHHRRRQRALRDTGVTAAHWSVSAQWFQSAASHCLTLAAALSTQTLCVVFSHHPRRRRHHHRHHHRRRHYRRRCHIRHRPESLGSQSLPPAWPLSLPLKPVCIQLESPAILESLRVGSREALNRRTSMMPTRRSPATRTPITSIGYGYHADSMPRLCFVLVNPRSDGRAQKLRHGKVTADSAGGPNYFSVNVNSTSMRTATGLPSFVPGSKRHCLGPYRLIVQAVDLIQRFGDLHVAHLAAFEHDRRERTGGPESWPAWPPACTPA